MKKLIAIAAVADFLWAALLATFASNFILVFLHMAKAGHTSDVIGGVGAWIIVFVAAGVQGAVTIVAVTCAGAFIYALMKR